MLPPDWDSMMLNCPAFGQKRPHVCSMMLFLQKIVINKNSSFWFQMNNLRQEEKITSQARKKIHKAINARMEEITETVVKQIAEYGEGLHQEVGALTIAMAGLK